MRLARASMIMLQALHPPATENGMLMERVVMEGREGEEEADPPLHVLPLFIPSTLPLNIGLFLPAAASPQHRRPPLNTPSRGRLGATYKWRLMSSNMISNS
ncbi:hypothetical protein E2C01_052498 [Portunus trituberculatus]|uniref:Uncharacterized protein n=1 Tax=Portunus trituberculatus TaxID=210409 RepID=A0A5B7GLZ1_PORTR|nr:hypothetical protein [Portunus trituberculatus]